MRIGRVRSGDEVLLVRLEDGIALPLAVEDPVPGSDPMRALLARCPDPGCAPVLRPALEPSSWVPLCPGLDVLRHVAPVED